MRPSKAASLIFEALLLNTRYLIDAIDTNDELREEAQDLYHRMICAASVEGPKDVN
jgi:hypothetical protein